MSTLMIREIPEALDTFLKRSAVANRRSKEKQALSILEQAAGQQAVDWSDFIDKPRRKVVDQSDAIRKASR